MTQTLASGQTLASKYPELGGTTGQRQVAPLTSIMWFLIGLPGSGKSALLQGCEDAFIFNLDEASTTASVPRATLWPSMDPVTGRASDGGRPLILSWELVAEKIAVLKRLAKEGKPRPKMVVFDNLTSAIFLLKKWMPPRAKELNLAAGPLAHWKDLHGQAAWDLLYDILVKELTDLHSHGYGVCFVGHIVNAKIPLGDDKFVFKPELTITDTFYKRIFPWFEMVAAVSVRPISTEREVEDKVTVQGRQEIFKRKVTETAPRRVFVTDDTDLAGILKPRVVIPGALVLPDDGWPVVEAAYVKAAIPVSPKESP